MKKGFTLIELIVVITILAILGTIAFISFKGFSSEARNSARISDSTNIVKGLAAMKVKDGVYPAPDSSFKTLTSNSKVYSLQGKMGDLSQNKIGINGAKDPSSNNFYDYSTNEKLNKFSLGVNFEGDVSYGINMAMADDGVSTFKQYGKNVGFLVKKGTKDVVKSDKDITLTNSDSTYELLIDERVYTGKVISYASMKSCKEIHDSDSSAKTGKYLITPKETTFEVYCDMDYEGGGWTYWNGGKVDDKTEDKEFLTYGYNENVPEKFNELYRIKAQYLKDIDFTESVTFMKGETSDYSARFKYPTTMNAEIPYENLWNYLEGKTFKGYFTHNFKESVVLSRYNDGKPKRTQPKGKVNHSESGVDCYSTNSKMPGHFKCGTNKAETSQNPWYQSWRVSDNYTTYNSGDKGYFDYDKFDKSKLGYGVHTCTRVSDENGSTILNSCDERLFSQGLFQKPGCNNTKAKWMNFITGNQCDYRQDTSTWYEWRDYVR